MGRLQFYLHGNHILPLKTSIDVGKYTSPMDGMGYAPIPFASGFGVGYGYLSTF